MEYKLKTADFADYADFNNVQAHKFHRWLTQGKKFTRQIYSAFTETRLGGIGFFEPQITRITLINIDL